MELYSEILLHANSKEISVYEPDEVFSQSNNGMAVGKNSDGDKKAFFIQLPANRPLNAHINTAKIKLAQSDTGTVDELVIKCSPVAAGEVWEIDTTYTEKPAIDTSVEADLTVSGESNSSTYNSATDYRTGYVPKYYWYDKFVRLPDGHDGTYIGEVPKTSDHGGFYTDGTYNYWWTRTTAAYYTTYARYREWDLTAVYQYMIDNGLDSLAFWFDESGASNTHKYFYSTANTNINLLPLFTVEYELLPALDVPAITQGNITSENPAIDFPDGVDENGYISAANMTYEVELSTDGGTNYGDALTSFEGSSQISADLLTYLSKLSGQYYYNANCKLHVRCYGEYEGDTYYSDWTESGVFAIDWRVAPTAPSLTPSDTTPYEGEEITFVCGRPTSYNAYKNDGSGNTLHYYVDRSIGAALADGEEAVTADHKDIAYTVGNLTDGDDLAVNIKARCIDGEGQAGAYCENVAMTIKRFRKPIVNIAGSLRTSDTTALIYITIDDTGYGLPQSIDQINKIEVKIDDGIYADATLVGWDGYNNTISLTGLAAGRRNISVRADNNAPAGTALSDKTGDADATVLLEFSPVFARYTNPVSGVSGVKMKSFVCSDDFADTVSKEGDGYIQKDINVGGDAYITGDMSAGNFSGTSSGMNTGDQDLSDMVEGPASATNGGIAAFDGTTGKLIKNTEYGPDVLVKAAAANQSVQHGFAYFQGNGSTVQEVSINFDTAYDVGSFPIVIPVLLQTAKATSGGPPSTQNDWDTPLTTPLSYGPVSATNTGFTVRIIRSSAISSNYYYGLFWIAIGAKARQSGS